MIQIKNKNKSSNDFYLINYEKESAKKILDASLNIHKDINIC